MNKTTYNLIKKQLNNFYLDDIDNINQCCSFVNENNKLIIMANIKHAALNSPYVYVPVNTIMAFKVEEDGYLAYAGDLTYSTNSYLKTVFIEQAKCGVYSEQIFAYLETLAKLNNFELIEASKLIKNYEVDTNFENLLKQNNYTTDETKTLVYIKNKEDFRNLESIDIKQYDFVNEDELELLN